MDLMCMKDRRWGSSSPLVCMNYGHENEHDDEQCFKYSEDVKGNGLDLLCSGAHSRALERC